MPNYEIRRSSQVLWRSSVPDCGCSKETLKDMQLNGRHLYCNGKKVKSRSGRSRTESGSAGV